jgi:hypothetical protein
MLRISKSFLALAVLLLSLGACIDEEQASTAPSETTGDATLVEPTPAVDSSNFTYIQWMDSVKNLGVLKEGEKIEVLFPFKNIGDKPLVINNVVASCGCTVPEKPEEPIMPGKQGIIKAVFDSKGRAGTNHKTITVKANTFATQNHLLEFDVEVKAADNKATKANG